VDGVVGNLRMTMGVIVGNRFEYQVAANMSNVAEAVHEVGSKYLGWEMTLYTGA
jgi:hypothetical protein